MRSELQTTHELAQQGNARLGQAKQARAELSAAIDLYRDTQMSFWLPETEAALAQVNES